MRQRWKQIFISMGKYLNKGSQMIDHNFEKRLTSTNVFYGYLSDLIGNFSAIKTSKSRLDEQFQNKILLAVTQVNGCRYCSYLHTKHALESGMSEEEITSLLAGEVGDINDEESVALIFAQHYAETQQILILNLYRDCLILMEMKKPMILLPSFKLLWLEIFMVFL